MDDIDIMDKKSVSYDRVLVDGTLVFLSSMSYDITLNKLVGYGSILVGSQSSPFGLNTFRLTVTEEILIGKVSAYSNEK